MTSLVASSTARLARRLALAAVGLTLVAADPATAGPLTIYPFPGSSRPSLITFLKRYEVTTWRRDVTPSSLGISLGPTSEKLCYLSGFAGRLDNRLDRATVFQWSGQWWLRGEGRITSVTATCVPFRNFRQPPALIEIIDLDQAPVSNENNLHFHRSVRRPYSPSEFYFPLSLSGAWPATNDNTAGETANWLSINRGSDSPMIDIYNKFYGPNPRPPRPIWDFASAAVARYRIPLVKAEEVAFPISTQAGFCHMGGLDTEMLEQDIALEISPGEGRFGTWGVSKSGIFISPHCVVY